MNISEMTDSEKNDFINFIYGQLKEREAQNEALHAKLDAQMERFDKLQATLDAISGQLAESNKMKEDLQKGFDNMHTQLEQMKNELVKTQKELRKSQREAKKYKEQYESLRALDNPEDVAQDANFMNKIPDYQEGLQYSAEVIASVRYGYMYRKDAEEHPSVHACIDIDPEFLYWLAGLIRDGLVWDMIKSAAKQLYNRLSQEGSLLDKYTKSVLTEEKELELFYQRVREYNNQCMAITEKQFNYIREEIMADVYGEEAQKIFDREQRQPNHQEFLEMHRKAIKKADDLLGKYNTN